MTKNGMRTLELLIVNAVPYTLRLIIPLFYNRSFKCQIFSDFFSSFVFMSGQGNFKFILRNGETSLRNRSITKCRKTRQLQSPVRRIRIRIYSLARRNLLWDILRLLSSRRAVLGLYVILTLWRGRGANQPPYALAFRSSPFYTHCHSRQQVIT